MLVRRSTVDLRSCSRSGLLAGKLFCWHQVCDERPGTVGHGDSPQCQHTGAGDVHMGTQDLVQAVLGCQALSSGWLPPRDTVSGVEDLGTRASHPVHGQVDPQGVV